MEDGFGGEFWTLDRRLRGWKGEEGMIVCRTVHSEPEDLCCLRMAGSVMMDGRKPL